MWPFNFHREGQRLLIYNEDVFFGHFLLPRLYLIVFSSRIQLFINPSINQMYIYLKKKTF